MIDNKEVKNRWDCCSDEYYADQYKDTDTIDIIKNAPHRAFPPIVWENIQSYFPDLRGVKVCVPSSGDNVAALAFHVLGARVTSCDISTEQIKNARRIAESQGWDIDFHACDSMGLRGIGDREYDLVYTSNGVHVWISDLAVMYGSFRRILKRGGRYVFFETHPFIRPFDDSTTELKIIKPYDQIKPDLHWRVQDIINALIGSGFTIRRMDEFFAQKNTLGANWWYKDEVDWDEMSDWHKNPYAALPQWLSICSD